MDARAASGASRRDVLREREQARKALLARLARPAGEAPVTVFCSGIGGTGLSGLAGLARALGHDVRGSDQKPSAGTRALEAKGIQVAYEQKAENLGGAVDLMIATAALPPTHPEVEGAATRGVPVVKYAEALGAFLAARRGIAISGTHGKSTTTAMTSHVLIEAGKDPTWVVGGQVPQLGGSSALGHGPDMVIEACEYDRSFWNYVPSTALVLNVEEDHLDCYGGGLPEIIDSFVTFGVRIREGGTLVVSADWPAALRVGALVKDARPDVFVDTFGESETARVRARDLRFEDGLGRFTLEIAGVPQGEVTLAVPGRHNVANALAAIAATVRAGVEPMTAARALATFRGVGRRFEVLHDQDVAVVDDYAHHPTAIEVVVAAARERFPARRLVAVFEPHQASRTRHLFQEFASALAGADRVVLADVYACRDRAEDVSAVSGDKLAEAVRALRPGTEALHASGVEGLLAAARALARPGDAFLFLGAGSTATTAARRFAKELDGREPEAPFDSGRDASRLVLRSGRTDHGAGRAETRSVAERLKEELGPRLAFDQELAPRVTFHAGGRARFFVEPRTQEDAAHALAALRRAGVPVYVLGGGSNTLARDGTWDGAVIATKRLQAITVDGTTVRALAGSSLQRVSHKAEEAGLAGLELFAGIPGTIGGAVAGNAGGPRNAGTVGERVVRARVALPDGQVRWLDRSELGLGYRKSNLGGAVLIEVELSLARDRAEAIRARRLDALQQKARLQPLSAWSAGCIFRNPQGDSAGRLIDASGLKGLRRGGAVVSPVHANFIVNAGGATAADILGLAHDVRAAIDARHGRRLELELRVVGEEE